MKKFQKKQIQTPRNARSEREILQLKRDNLHTTGYWFILDVETVAIAKQKTGEPADWMHSIPRSTFEKFIDWYNTGVCKGGRRP